MDVISRITDFGEDQIFSLIKSGSTQTEVAEKIGISVSALNTWLHASPESSARAREAMAASAESWLDRGLKPLQEALDKGSKIDAQAARAYAQECARRAAIRNPRYREKISAEISGVDGKPIELVRREIIRPKPEGK